MTIESSIIAPLTEIAPLLHSFALDAAVVEQLIVYLQNGLPVASKVAGIKEFLVLWQVLLLGVSTLF